MERTNNAATVGKTLKFATNLSQLRKEKGISQKAAAADLGISQALLSHYEKGIRECGLDFVIRCSEYYGVSTDYLLGVSDVRHGMNEEYFSKMTAGASEHEESMARLSQGMKLLIDAALSTDKKRKSVNYLHDCYMLSLYSIAQTLRQIGSLPDDMFMIDYNVGHELAAAATTVLHSRFAHHTANSNEDVLNMDNATLRELVKGAEKYLMDNYIFK